MRLLLLFLLLTGCSVFAPIEEKLAGAVNRYCEEPFNERTLLRENVNRIIAPNEVKVWCEGDPQE